jgi:hypothetical protein
VVAQTGRESRNSNSNSKQTIGYPLFLQLAVERCQFVAIRIRLHTLLDFSGQYSSYRDMITL